MKIIAAILTCFVLIQHVYIVWLEMFAWETVGKKIFGKSLSAELFKPTKTLAANQGLYNGFLVAGLVWSFLIQHEAWSFNVKVFFLSCVIVAGLYGGLTVSKRIFYVQAVPAILALLACVLA